MRSGLRVLMTVTVIALASAPAVADAAPDVAADDGARRTRERHIRLTTDRGPIHVWTPAGYDPRTAATVVYVHGYFARVDTAWSAYRLRKQFRDSGINAMFVACEAPTSARDDIAWPLLEDLLLEVTTQVGPLPRGRLVMVGHSGAHRTLVGWLANPRVDTIAMLDAAYGDLTAYSTWLDAREDRRLIDVGDLRRPETDAFHKGLPDTVVINRFPRSRRGKLPSGVREARVVYIRSRMGHMPLVTSGIAIPIVLRTLATPRVLKPRKVRKVASRSK